MPRKLFSSNPARIGRFDSVPTSDAVPASLVDGTPADPKADLIALLGRENVLHRRTCEMGLRQATGLPYESFIYLLEELTAPGGTPTTLGLI